MEFVRREFLGLVGAALAKPVLSQSAALTILIIRHAEKPDEFWPGPWLDLRRLRRQEIPGDPRLAARRQLVRAVRRWPGRRRFPRAFRHIRRQPGHARRRRAEPAPVRNHHPARSPTDLTPFVTYAVGQEPQLVAEIVNRTGVVLVCWEHKAIVSAILPTIAGGQPLPGMPKKWDGARFDVVLRFDRSAPGAPWSFRQLFPRLQSGDSDTPLK